MTPAPTLTELIQTVTSDAPSPGDLDRLATASATVAGLEEVGDALLSHFVDQCRRNGRSWSEISTALGVSKQAAHKRFTVPAPTFERFTMRARNALDESVTAAGALGHDHVGTEHLVLGLLAVPEGLAAKIMVGRGATAEVVAAKVLARSPVGRSIDRTPPYSPRLKAALEKALYEAVTLGHNYIGTEHLLLGVFADANATGCVVLRELGVEADAVRAEVRTLLEALTKEK